MAATVPEWPEIPYPPWRETCTALHLFAQIVGKLEAELGGDIARLHYLSVPPAAAPEVVRSLGEVGLAERARIIMELSLIHI